MTKAVDVETIEKNSKQNTVGKISPAKKIALRILTKNRYRSFEKEISYRNNPSAPTGVWNSKK